MNILNNKFGLGLYTKKTNDCISEGFSISKT